MMNEHPYNDYRDYLEHSAKGTHWKKGHKYIAIINGRYIYEDLKKKASEGLDKIKNAASKAVDEYYRQQALKDSRAEIREKSVELYGESATKAKERSSERQRKRIKKQQDKAKVDAARKAYEQQRKEKERKQREERKRKREERRRKQNANLSEASNPRLC